MKLKEFNFNSVKPKSKFDIVGLVIKEEGAAVWDKNKSYSGFIGEVLNAIPIEWAEREIKETRWFFNEFVIELEKEKLK